MNRTEIMLGSLALLSLSADLLGAPIGAQMLVVSFSTLAIFYYFFAYPIFNQLPLKMALVKGGGAEHMEINRTAARLFGAATAFVIIGFLFKLLEWPNAGEILIVSTIGLTLAIIVMFVWIKKSKSESSILQLTIKRLAIFDIVGIVFLTA